MQLSRVSEHRHRLRIRLQDAQVIRASASNAGASWPGHVPTSFCVPRCLPLSWSQSMARTRVSSRWLVEMAGRDDRRCSLVGGGHRKQPVGSQCWGTHSPTPASSLAAAPVRWSVGHDVKLSLSAPGQNRRRQGFHVHRVTAGVIDPAFTEHRVHRGGDQEGFKTGDGRTSVGDRNLEDPAICGPEQMRLYPDRTVGIIESVGPDNLDAGGIDIAEPGLVWNPRLEKLDLGGIQRCLVKEGHGATLSPTLSEGQR